MSLHDEPDAVIRSTRSRRPRREDPPDEARTVESSGEEGTEEIRVEIEQTRTEMSGTLDALSEKLDPGVIAAQATAVAQDVTEQAIERAKEAAKETARDVTGQAKEAAWDATVGRAEQAVEATVEKAEEVVSSAGETARGVGSTMLETIRQNPVPAALAGLSLGWLWMNRSGGPSARTSYYAYEAGRYPPPPYPAGRTRSASGGIADQVGETASQAGEKVGQVVSDAGERVSEVASSAGQMAGEMATSAGEMARDTGSSIVDIIQENPVPAALTGLGLAWLYMSRSSGPSGRASYPYGAGRTSYSYGAGRTPYAYGGETYYRDRGRSATGEVADRVGEAASRAGDAASQAGEKVGQIASSAGETAGEMVSTAGETVRQTGSTVVDIIQENPVPAALTGLGLAWLYMNRSSGRSGRPSYPYGAGRTYYGDQDRSMVGEVADKVGETAGQVQDKAAELAGQARDTAGDVVGQAQYGAKRAGGRAQQMLETNPLMAAALAATVGGAVGLAMPETRREDQLMGRARDSLMGQAQDVTQETMEKVERVTEGAKKEAQEQGLTV